jgi:uncharacterized membrane protein YedE/YeeE
MNCFTHHDRAALGLCKHCQHGLCGACATEVAGSLACRGRCESQVENLDRIVRLNTMVMERTTAAYVRSAMFYGLVAVAFIVAGLAEWRGFGWILVPASLIFGASAWVQVSTGRRFHR